jgi:2,3-bisphosphoglycerate-independent phosphoglycerate mutase
MVNDATGQPHTAHTNNQVPLIYVGKKTVTAAKTGALDDVAPTMLYLMGLQQPSDMTGHTLFQMTGK